MPEEQLEVWSARARSIQNLCKNDYTPDQIEAWSRSTPKPEDLQNFLSTDFVWVIEIDGKIEGMAHLKPPEYLQHLYLSDNAVGKGLGKQLYNLVEAKAKELGAKKIRLRSSVTALAFYKSQGFVEIGPHKTECVGGQNLACVEMQKILSN